MRALPPKKTRPTTSEVIPPTAALHTNACSRDTVNDTDCPTTEQDITPVLIIIFDATTRVTVFSLPILL
jgi:hypothetical protein